MSDLTADRNGTDAEAEPLSVEQLQQRLDLMTVARDTQRARARFAESQVVELQRRLKYLADVVWKRCDTLEQRVRDLERRNGAGVVV